MCRVLPVSILMILSNLQSTRGLALTQTIHLVGKSETTSRTLSATKETDRRFEREPTDEPKQTHIVQWTTEEGTVEFEAHHGELLRTAALRRGIVSPHNGKSKLINCRGLGTCGTCAVEVAKGGVVEPRERNNRERLRLSFPPHNPDKQSPFLRLACQLQVHGDLQVTKRAGFWGQYDDLSPSGSYQTFFGDLEYLLDDKSPNGSQ